MGFLFNVEPRGFSELLLLMTVVIFMIVAFDDNGHHHDYDFYDRYDQSTAEAFRAVQKSGEMVKVKSS